MVLSHARILIVGEEGFEPSSLSACGPKPHVSANCTTRPHRLTNSQPRLASSSTRGGSPRRHKNKTRIHYTRGRPELSRERDINLPLDWFDKAHHGSARGQTWRYSPSLTNAMTFFKTAGSCSARSARIFRSNFTFFFLSDEMNLL